MNKDKNNNNNIGVQPMIKKKMPQCKPIYPKVVKCTKCKKYNSVIASPEFQNISNCYFCGNPYYIIRMDK